MTNKRAWTAAALVAIATGGALALAQNVIPAAAAVQVAPSPSPSLSESPWCTSEPPPSSYPGGPSYPPQCPGPYVSPTGDPSPGASDIRIPVPRMRPPLWGQPDTSPSATACPTVQDWRTVAGHRYRLRLCGDLLALDQS